MTPKKFRILRHTLALLAFLLPGVPIFIATVFDRPFSALWSSIFLSGFYLCLTGAVWSTSKWKEKKSLPNRIGFTIGVAILLLLQWL